MAGENWCWVGLQWGERIRGDRGQFSTVKESKHGRRWLTPKRRYLRDGEFHGGLSTCAAGCVRGSQNCGKLSPSLQRVKEDWLGLQGYRWKQGMSKTFLQQSKQRTAWMHGWMDANHLLLADTQTTLTVRWQFSPKSKKKKALQPRENETSVRFLWCTDH